MKPTVGMGTGIIELGQRDSATGAYEQLAQVTNAWMYTYAYLIAKCLGHGDVRYRPGTFYLEFENVASPSTVVTTPVVTASDTLAYYQGLATSPTRDFMRFPAFLPDIQIATGFEEEFTLPQGNQLAYIGQIAGPGTGVHGKTFSSAVNSKVCGVALVATPMPDDWTQDILWGRQYFTSSQQQLVVTGKQLVTSYKLVFPL